MQREGIRKTEHVSANGEGYEISPLHVKEILLVLLAAAHIIWSLSTMIPAYLLIDEALYHWMSESFSDTWGLALWTGYDEFPSEEFLHRHTRLHDGRVFAQYPHFFTIFSWPLYRTMGLLGLFMANAVSFLGVIALCYAGARRLFHDRDIAVNSCLILALTTFFWEYSQAAWPHTTSSLFVLAAFYLAVRADEGASKRSEGLFALSAGLIAGFGSGIRMDGFLIIPCVLFWWLFRSKPGITRAVVFLMGTIPGLAALAYTNHIKFGVLSPFSYGDSSVGFMRTLPPALGAAAFAFMLFLWVATRPSVEERIRSRLGWGYPLIFAVLIFSAVSIAGVFFPGDWAILKRTLRGFFEAVVDIRAIDLGASFPSMERSRGGGVIYGGAHKKALLQSLPYLTLLAIPFVEMIRNRAERYRLTVLFSVPAAFIALHAYLISEHGGLCLNYRYFVSIFPFTSILCAYAWAKLNEDWRKPAGYTALAAATVVTAAAFAFFMRRFVTLEALEFPLLTLPHFMAAFIGSLVIAGYAVKTRGVRLLRIACMITIGAAMTSSGLTAFFYDYARHRETRLKGFIFDQKALTKVPPNSLFISTAFLGPSLIQGHKIRIAFPAMDQGRDTPKLIAFHLAEGRRVFGVFSKPLINHILKAESSDYAVKPVLILSGRLEALVEISPAPTKPEDKRSDVD